VKIIHSIHEMQSVSNHLRELGKSIGFVPTMGALHQGHLKLAEYAQQNNDVVVCSIFVNPIQFNNAEDLKKYPRNFQQDADMLESMGCDVIFYPTVEEMYPEPVTYVYDFGILDKVMEGKYRPGHFNGVAIVVKKLFDIVLPHRAYFGQKDYQQLAVIKALVKQENINVEIISCPTIREADGLAMSSRNQRLTAEERMLAPVIYQTLVAAEQRSKKHRLEEVKRWVEYSINSHASMKLEYFEISDAETLQPVSELLPNQPVVACIAVFMGQVRLIDNLLYNL
jgi:pantoate--beta-alanine ligase